MTQPERGWQEVSGNGRHYDELLIAALAGGASITRAAEMVGAAERTVRRRLADTAFAARLEGARRQVVVEAIDQLGAATTAATTTLAHLMSDRYPPPVRLRAALAVLETYHKYKTAAELEGRLSALEAASAAQQPGR
jgi:hypothetical protein